MPFSALMHKDVELADCMVARLGELLRSTLDNLGAHEVLVTAGVGFRSALLEIEQARLGERLTVDMNIDPNTMDLQVPNFILQPLVENAIRTASLLILIRAGSKSALAGKTKNSACKFVTMARVCWGIRPPVSSPA